MQRVVAAVAPSVKDADFVSEIASPGVQGFLFTALLGASVIVLGFFLVSRLRRNSFRHQIQEEIASELAAHEKEVSGDDPHSTEVSRDESDRPVRRQDPGESNASTSGDARSD